VASTSGSSSNTSTKLGNIAGSRGRGVELAWRWECGGGSQLPHFDNAIRMHYNEFVLKKHSEQLPRPAAELERLAEYYGTHDTSTEMDNGDWVEPQPMATTSLRLPADVIDQLKQQARTRHVRYTTYVRAILERAARGGSPPEWVEITERLDRIERALSAGLPHDDQKTALNPGTGHGASSPRSARHTTMAHHHLGAWDQWAYCFLRGLSPRSFGSNDCRRTGRKRRFGLSWPGPRRRWRLCPGLDHARQRWTWRYCLGQACACKGHYGKRVALTSACLHGGIALGHP
jgi:hypothetical protein